MPGKGAQLAAEVPVLADALHEPASPGQVLPVRGRTVGHLDQAAQLGADPLAAARYFRRGILRKLPRPPRQVGEAALPGSSRPLEVDCEAVRDEDSGPVADQPGKRLRRAGFVNHEVAERGADHGPQPAGRLARRTEEPARRLVDEGNEHAPDLLQDAGADGLCGRGSSVEAFLDATLRNLDLADHPVECLDLPPGQSEDCEERRRRGKPGPEARQGFRRHLGLDAPAASVAGALPDAVVRHNRPDHQLDHLEEGILPGPGKLARMAVGAFPGVYIFDFVRLAGLLRRAGMACLAGLCAPAGPFPAGGAAGVLLLLLRLLLPGRARLLLPARIKS